MTGLVFPAADDDAWTLIKDVIDECDYYILVVAGRYGSCDKEGVSYTEREYRYAIEKGKRVLAFLHSNAGSIPQNKCEQSREGKQKLDDFRALARAKVSKPWGNADELASVVSRSLVQLINRYPAVGWVRADQLPADDILAEAIRLQKRVRELEEQLRRYEEGPPPNAAYLAQGEDTLTLTFVIDPTAGKETKSVEVNVSTTWDEVFAAIARLLYEEPTDRQIMLRIQQAFKKQWVRKSAAIEAEMKTGKLSMDSLELLRVQFRALGLVTQEHVTTSSQPRGGFIARQHRFFRWTLTPYGERKVAEILAVRKDGTAAS